MPKPLKGKSILVIDDDAGMLRALSKVLSGEGAEVTSADSAVEAIEILGKREIQFDLVSTDLRMPFVNGVTVVYAIHEVFPSLPVVVVTAFADPEARAACLAEGAVAFLEKPLNTEELMTVVCRTLRIATPIAKASRSPLPKLSGTSSQLKSKTREGPSCAKPNQEK